MFYRFTFIFLSFFILVPENVVSSIDSNIIPVNKQLEKGVFLIANSDSMGPYFTNSVILLTEYSSEGALGIIINHPTAIMVLEVLPDLEGLDKKTDFLFSGGPVLQSYITMLLSSDKLMDDTKHVFGKVYYSTSTITLGNMIKNNDPNEAVRLYAGYAGWVSGQLEAEITRGSWRLIPADQYTIFNKDPESIWEDLTKGNSQLYIKKMDNSGAKAGLKKI